MEATRIPRQYLNTTRLDGWKIVKYVPKKTWIAQVADDLHPLHFTINDEKQAAKNHNQWHAIVRDIIPLCSTALITTKSLSPSTPEIMKNSAN